MWKGFFFGTWNQAPVSRRSRKIAKSQTLWLMSCFFIYSFWIKRSSLQIRIFRHIHPLFLNTNYETFTGLLRKGPFHYKMTLKQDRYRILARQDQQLMSDRIKVLHMWRFVLKVVWYPVDANPFNQLNVENILKWRQHFLPRLEWYKEIIKLIR